MSFSHGGPGTSASVWRAAVDALDLAPLGLEGIGRVVVLAAHPDDESLGAGGLVAAAHRAGLEVVVVVATRGEGSHPRSPTVDRERLAALRSDELRSAARTAVARACEPHLVGWPDGAVADHEDDLATYVVDLVGDGRHTLLVATWRHDGHPDHEAVGRAAATVAARTGARLLEYPVWFWHWARPEQAPWADARRLDLTADSAERKRAAIVEHRTQVQALSDLPGDEVLLEPAFLEHFAASYELFWEQPPARRRSGRAAPGASRPLGCRPPLLRAAQADARHSRCSPARGSAAASSWAARPGRSPRSSPNGATSWSRSTRAAPPSRRRRHVYGTSTTSRSCTPSCPRGSPSRTSTSSC